MLYYRYSLFATNNRYIDKIRANFNLLHVYKTFFKLMAKIMFFYYW